MEHLEQDCARMDAENEAIRAAEERSAKFWADLMHEIHRSQTAAEIAARNARIYREIDRDVDMDDSENEDIMAGLQEEQNDNG